MKEDDLSPILNKTRDYFSFVKRSLSKKAIELRDKDSDSLEKIESNLKILGGGIDGWSQLKTKEYKSILSKCFRYLQQLDRIAKDYKLFLNDSPHW